MSPAVALIGQPHVGKSTIFALLTGISQRVDTWPGTSIERRTGICKSGQAVLTVVELPSLYSLSDSGCDQRIILNYLTQDPPDVIVFIANAATLERTLYLLAELIWLPIPMVVVVNMMDVAHSQGIEIDSNKLQSALGIPVVPMTAIRGQGETELMAAIAQAIAMQPYAPSRPAIREDHGILLQRVQKMIAGHIPSTYPEDLVAFKLLEGDPEITAMVQQSMGEQWREMQSLLIQHDDAAIAVASGRYEWIAGLLRTAVRQPRSSQMTMTDNIDRIATHPILGLLLLLAVMSGVFWLIYSVGTPLQRGADQHIVQAAADYMHRQLYGLPTWFVGLLADGVIGGAGTVITLLPILIVFFTLLGALQECGYIARAAYVVDRFMHLMGLHGNSFIPLFLGFGCNVPAILASRIIPSGKARLLTILVTPLVPCGARLAVLAILPSLFFGQAAFLISAGLVAMSLVLLVVIGIVLHEYVLGGEHVAFIMELPLYHAPNPRTVALKVWQQTVSFIKEAGTTIVFVSVLLWFLSTFPDGHIETSYLARLGHLLSPIGALMGLSWQMMVALLTSLVRKENTIATLGVLYGAGQIQGGWMAALAAALSPAAALAFLATQVLFIPCVATTISIHEETASWRWTLLDLAVLLVVSLAAGILIYQAAHLLGL